MSYRSYALATAVIFLVIAVLHLLRVIFGWDATIARAAVPKWVSCIALLMAGYLAFRRRQVTGRPKPHSRLIKCLSRQRERQNQLRIEDTHLTVFLARRYHASPR